MELYLIRNADTDPERATDPYSVPLSPLGCEQARRLGARSAAWDLQMLCVSPMRRGMDTADPINEARPNLVRWDLQELEDLSLDDLNYEPGATHLVATWNEDQIARGYFSMWARVTAAYTRILLYAQSHGIERIGIVADETALNLVIALLLGLDWSLLRQARMSFAACRVCRATVVDGEPTVIAWL